MNVPVGKRKRAASWKCRPLVLLHLWTKCLEANRGVSDSGLGLTCGGEVKNLMELRHQALNVGGLEAAACHRQDYIAATRPLAPILGEQGRQFGIVLHGVTGVDFHEEPPELVRPGAAEQAAAVCRQQGLRVPGLGLAHNGLQAGALQHRAGKARVQVNTRDFHALFRCRSILFSLFQTSQIPIFQINAPLSCCPALLDILSRCAEDVFESIQAQCHYIR